MKIAIIDCRLTKKGLEHSLRADDLKKHLQDYDVTITPNVNFDNTIPLRWSEVKATVEQGAASFDVIILHVGTDQTHVRNSYQDICDILKDKYIVCFSGSDVPGSYIKDCQNNVKHCYIKDTIGTSNQWPALWKTRILDYLRLLKEGQPEDARNLIMNFNPKLEKALDDLQDMLCTHFKSGNPLSQKDLVDLTNKRNTELTAAYQ